ncbi:hypothetical protein D0C36_08130 [Mucilaginibacter conchicola]|uniref:FAS1 domain-containing protein n=1 Tax=Mucilaginibacter conchicola TaxID=2303333 RepID=A0A372NZC9_9SPHI|nr:fasciclin domain-containing protein [Mucilaginibacter conchicola]RFZ95478.1 hypothetical protein D0C36_08130 [Mucilaginibacter conchicola]
MKQINTFIKRTLPALVLVLLFAGCQKTEFIPPAEGEKIPYNPEVNKDLNQVLSQSPYTIFNAAWKRSTIAEAPVKTNAKYTLLVPTDAVMQAAGYTADAISKMAVNDVDSLVSYYTIRVKLTKADLQLNGANLEGVSLHPRADLLTKDGTVNYNAPYYYRHYLGIDGNKLLVNSIPSGDADAAIEATNGSVFPISRLIPVPTKSFVGALEADQRFSMFLEVTRRTDLEHNKQYNDLYMENYGFEPGDDYRRKLYPTEFDIRPGVSVPITMMFAPTNDAFKAAGFNTVEDVLEWNKRAKPMEFDWNIGEPTDAGFPSDTVLNYHWDFGRQNLPYTNMGKDPAPKPTLFFSNDLRNDLLGNYLINYDVNYVKYLMPYTFTTTADSKVQMQIKGSAATPATVTETINTLMGPIHVVDRLLVPKDFKMK